MKKSTRTAVLVSVVAIGASGCASIVGGTAQVVSVETMSAGQSLTGASCTLKNPKGEYFVTTPGTLTVNRAYDDLVVKCTREGFAAATASAKSTTKGMAFGNIIFGGVIGGAVDVSTGAAYDYPTLITVQMQSLAAGAQPAATDAAQPPTAPGSQSAAPGAAVEGGNAVESQASR